MVTKSHYNLQSLMVKLIFWKQDDGFDLTHAHVYTWICSRLPPQKKTQFLANDPHESKWWTNRWENIKSSSSNLDVTSFFPTKHSILWLLYGYCIVFNGFLHFHPWPRALKKRPPPRCTKGQRLVQYRAILGTSCVVVTCFIPSGLLSNKTM